MDSLHKGGNESQLILLANGGGNSVAHFDEVRGKENVTVCKSTDGDSAIIHQRIDGKLRTIHVFLHNGTTTAGMSLGILNGSH